MNYLTTTGKYNNSLRSAALNPVAADGSLYIPERLPVIPSAFINNMSGMTAEEIAFAVTNTLLDGEINGNILRSVVHQAFSDPMPLVRVDDNVMVAELFHGPTLSYKDIGARFATGIIGHLLSNRPGQILGIASTAGNTGAALAATFRQNMPEHSALLILYPSGNMTRAQISQFTTPGNKVLAVEIAGTIDDCRKLGNRLHAEISSSRPEITAIALNSANLLRIIPQVAVFFHIYAEMVRKGFNSNRLRVVIPSGNLTNLTAAIIAARMGLSNLDIVAVTSPDSTYARAMVASPTPINLDRAVALAGGSEAFASLVTTIDVNDRQISEIIRSAPDYLPDPHTAAGLAAIKMLPDSPTVALGTAHPAKSLDAMTAITGRAMEMPLQFTNFMHNTRPSARIAPSINALKKYLVQAFDRL